MEIAAVADTHIHNDYVSGALGLARRHGADYLRRRDTFVRGHLAGSVSVEYSHQFATYVGWLVPWADDLVLLYDSADDVGSALHDLAAIGIEGPGIHDLDPATALPATFRRTDWAGFREHLGPRVVVDVRQRDEYDEGHLPGAVHLPVHEVDRHGLALPPGELWVHCRSGYRAGIAASLLHNAGRDVAHVDDSWTGSPSWRSRRRSPPDRRTPGGGYREYRMRVRLRNHESDHVKKSDNSPSATTNTLAPGNLGPRMMRDRCQLDTGTWRQAGQGSKPMHLRKVLVLGAAVLAAGVLTATAAATGPSGPVASVGVGTISTGPNVLIDIDGYFTSGTISHGTNTYGCTKGDLYGTINRGPRPIGSTPDIDATPFRLTCPTPLGLDGNIVFPSGCFKATFLDSPAFDVHNGTVDTNAPSKYSRVAGTATITCGTITVPGGCSANLTGTVNAQFDEATNTPANTTTRYQQLILTGVGLSFSGQTGPCFGLFSGGITLNNITYNVQVTSPLIDFRQS